MTMLTKVAPVTLPATWINSKKEAEEFACRGLALGDGELTGREDAVRFAMSPTDHRAEDFLI